MSESKALTVRELIESLSGLPPDREVWTEGCDCWGQVGSVERIDDGWASPGILLRRPVDD